MFGADIFQRFCTNLHLREKFRNQFLNFVAAITFFCMSAKHNVSGQSSLYTALKTLEKSTHFMLTHVLYCYPAYVGRGHKLAAAHPQTPERQIGYCTPMKTIAYNKFNNNT